MSEKSEKKAHERKALVFVPGHGALSGAGAVYRDGDAVVVIGRIDHVRKIPVAGRPEEQRVHVGVDVMVRFPTVEAYDWAKLRMHDKDPIRYAKVVGLLNVDDDAKNAPALPEHLREGVRRNAEAAAAMAKQPTIGAPLQPFLLISGSGKAA